jgi:isopentenyldiphosphate isomerase
MSLLVSSPSPLLSEEEWQELQALLKAISHNPASVAPWKQEQFSSLFVRSLIGKGDMPVQDHHAST